MQLNAWESEIPELHLLVIDEDAAVRDACLSVAEKAGFAAIGAENPQAARTILKQRRMDVVLMNLKASGESGLNLLEEVKAQYPEITVIVMTAFGTVASAVKAMRGGAADYLTKPFALDELVTVLKRSTERRQFDVEGRLLQERLRNQKGVSLMIGRSPEMNRLYRILAKVSQSSHPVLILGESGTGKELIARAIHFNGPNADLPFVAVDCGSLMPALIATELFGYVKGAILGPQQKATHAKDGLLASAEGGTVFLNAVGELSPELQAKLVRVLQEKEVTPVGAQHAVPLRARILAATSRDLEAMVEQGRFRRDLYFRLNVVNLRIPPLRSRKEDIPVLMQHFLTKHQRETGRSHAFSDDALRALLGYEWPGNVRELETAIERACALSSGPVLHVADMPTQLQQFGPAAYAETTEISEIGRETMKPEEMRAEEIVSLAELERRAILGTMRQLNGDKLLTAKLLGIGKTTLYRKLKDFGFRVEAEEGST